MSALIGPLASGFADCPSGTVEFYARGTTDRATVYGDYDATVPITGFTLDSAGRKVAYATSLIDVRVRKADQTIAAEFSWAGRDSVIEVASPSFTGTLPTGSQGAGGITDLARAFSGMATSFGARDFKVRRTGAAADQYLKDALASLLASNSPFFVVTTYGAVGDGVADDSGAIVAATAAAAAAGGGIVFFPAGTYLIGTPMSITSNKVRWLGAGMNVVTLTAIMTPSIMITLNDSATSYAGFRASQMAFGGDATTWSLNAAPGATFEECRFAGVGAVSAAVSVLTRCRFVGCEFATNYITSASVSSGGAGTAFDNCRFVSVGTSAGNYAGILNSGTDVRVKDCDFDFSSLTSATSARGFSTAAGGCDVSGCKMLTDAAPTAHLIYLSADVAVSESGNKISGVSAGGLFGQAAATYESVITRGSRIGTNARSAVTTLNPHKDVETFWVTSNNNLTVNAPTGGQATNTSRMIIWVYNSSGGNITITWDAIFRTSSTGNLATLNVRCIEFRYNANAVAWEQVGGYVDYTK